MRYETNIIWHRYKSCNVCYHCNMEPAVKYIATGHDHTDYKYYLCNCAGAKRHGKPESECN